MTCTRAQEFLERHDLEASTLVDAKKTPLGRAEALSLAKQADEIYASKGKKVVHIDLKKMKPSDDEVTDLLLGPTGNLRAPTIRRGSTLLVGFDLESYNHVFTKHLAASK